jgi:hypothetical protein
MAEKKTQDIPEVAPEFVEHLVEEAEKGGRTRGRRLLGGEYPLATCFVSGSLASSAGPAGRSSRRPSSSTKRDCVCKVLGNVGRYECLQQHQQSAEADATSSAA